MQTFCVQGTGSATVRVDTFRLSLQLLCAFEPQRQSRNFANFKWCRIVFRFLKSKLNKTNTNSETQTSQTASPMLILKTLSAKSPNEGPDILQISNDAELFLVSLVQIQKQIHILKHRQVRLNLKCWFWRLNQPRALTKVQIFCKFQMMQKCFWFSKSKYKNKYKYWNTDKSDWISNADSDDLISQEPRRRSRYFANIKWCRNVFGFLSPNTKTNTYTKTQTSQIESPMLILTT